MSRFTHLTTDGQPVTMVNDQHQNTERGWAALVQTRSGMRLSFHLAELHPLGSLEAEEILEDLGLRTDQAVQEDDSNRTALARWTQCVDEARQALQDGITTVLGTSGVDGPGHASRRRLEQALDMALTELASFRP